MPDLPPAVVVRIAEPALFDELLALMVGLIIGASAIAMGLYRRISWAEAIGLSDPIPRGPRYTDYREAA